ncbi:hypothetical protein DL93DRAFT_2085546 [Clavulina sp. PMI_390]|nr:hypothetical protein DL93DRAFT_2085546 [Clavulina sp. PMI_390]
MKSQATIAQVKARIDVIAQKCAKLDKALSKGDKLNYYDGIKIAKKGVKLTHKLKKTAKLVLAVPPPILESDAHEILDKVHKLVPVCIGALDRVVEGRARFDKLQIAGLVKINVKRLSDGQVQLANALIERAPTDALKAEGRMIQQQLDDAFAKTLGAYSNAKGGEEKEAEVEGAADSDNDADDQDDEPESPTTGQSGQA